MVAALKSESVWDYPRPPALVADSRAVQVVFASEIVASTNRAYRVLETSHPPSFYIPSEDVNFDLVFSTPKRSFCEWKGAAQYWTIKVGRQMAENAAWSYPKPTYRFSAIKDYVSFYPCRMHKCLVGDEEVQSQEGEFYGGWITSEIKGPFKGGPDTWGW